MVYPYGVAPLHYLQDEEYSAELAQRVSSLIGKAIKLKITEVDEGAKFDDSYVDLKKFIQMDIEIESEDDEGDDDDF